MAADRDLLFGLLALQNGLIDQAQIVASFQAWTREKGRPLAAHLVARGDLEADDRSALDALVDRHLKRHGGDPEKSLAAVPAGRSTRESLIGLGDPDLEATVGHVGSAHGSPGEDAADRTGTYQIGTETGADRRFRVLRPHARGGLGAVFVALDNELHREVALKQILDHHADDPRSRQRFLLEAEITGGLEHPGIVPVYGLGSYGDGRPFYAMRFVRGDSLKDAIEQFHGGAANRADAGARSLGLRHLLRRFVDVCNAIDYAHARGVLHRDIKPGNVIVGRHGETLVIDWGLAKPMGRSEPGEGPGERTLVPSAASGSAETLPGSALGTPAYMSPEQAAGELDKLGPRSDVYSLGATLYCVLTGRPPTQGDDVGAVLRAVQKGEFPPPRAVEPAVDRALEAICLKAMALRPEDRFASCRALAEDIERWMADEPVSACRDPLARRLGRWARRNKTAVAVAAALLVAGAAGLAANNVLVERQRARAEANFQLARLAVDDMYTQVAERWLAQEPQMEPLQREFLLKALRFYERFARPDDASAEVRREAGKAARRVGEIHQKLGEHADADASFRRSRAILAAIDDDRAAQELAVTENRRGWFLWTVGRSPEDAFGRALAVGAALIRRAAATPESRRELARAYSSQGLVHAAFGRSAEAEAAHRQALSLREALVRDFDETPDYRLDLARTHSNLVTVLKQTGRFDQAEAESARAVEVASALLDQSPRDPNYRSDLALDLDQRANLVAMMGRPKEAEALLRRARDLSGRLAADFPRSLLHLDLDATVRRDLASLLNDHGQPRDARPEFERAIAVAETLVRRNPDVPSYRRTLALAHANLGDLLHSEGRPEDASREYREALRLTEGLVAELPGVLDYRSLRANYRASLAAMLRVTGRSPEAATAYDRVVDELEALSGEFPEVTHVRATLAINCARRGDVLGILKQPDRAEASLDRAIDLAEDLASRWPTIIAHHVTAASALACLSQLALERRDGDRARRLHERASSHLEVAFAADPESKSFRYVLMRTTAALAQLQAQQGDTGAVEATARRLDELPRSAIEHYNAACFQSLAASALEGPSAPEARRAALIRSLSDRAMAHLREAIALGYRNLKLLKTDPELDPLRPREDFQALLSKLSQDVKPNDR